MPEQIYIGNFAKGLKTNRLPFNIDNDAFPVLYNAYSWRGRAKRKRGTSALARLQRQIQSVAAVTLPWQFASLAPQAGVYQLITGNWTQGVNATVVPIEANASITPGSLTLVINGNTYTEPAIPDGTLLKNGVADPESMINYATGTVTIASGAVGNLTGTFSYYPDLPVLGLEDFVSNSDNAQFPLLLAFDPTYSYQINQSVSPKTFYSTSYYKNSNVPVTWSADDSNLFWSTNYQSAFWVTNNKPGLHFVNGTVTGGSGTNVLTFSFTSGVNPFLNLVVGDVLFFNEWSQPTAKITDATQTNPLVLTANNTFAPGQQITISGAVGMTQLNQGTFTITASSLIDITIGGTDSKKFGAFQKGTTATATLVATNTINGSSGIVTAVLGAGSYQVKFDDIETVTGSGIAFLLTNSISGQDGIRFYDGDPTGGTGLPTSIPATSFPITNANLGWVNFSPPLTGLTVSIADQVQAKYYLVGALAILPFKDRLLFFGPQIQSITGTTANPVIQKPLQDAVIWSWNGTPYYAELVPSNTTNSESFDDTAYYVDQAGKGGWLEAGISQPIKCVNSNEDVVLVGFGGKGKKTRFVFTGNDLQPFVFYLINNELPSSSTFSSVSMDRGMIDVGTYGITITTQQECSRIDLEIPDTIFDIQAKNNGQNRVNAIRDFYREWIYFSYPIGSGDVNKQSWKYPTQSLLFNYRDNTWAIFRENFTRHGIFRSTTTYTWTNLPFKSWAKWQEPWSSGIGNVEFPSIIAGNPQGYVVIKDEGTEEAPTGSISAIVNDGFGFTKIKSPNHCLSLESPVAGNIGDYLYFLGCIGSTFLNEKIGLVTKIIDANNFVVDIPFPSSPGTYLGLGTYTRLIQPMIQTKQFPLYWEEGRGVRLGVQKYLMDFTANGQVTVNINLSQDPDDAWNNSNIVPSAGVTNNALIYSQTLYTCPESTNLGLTPANTNLQMPTADGQFQIWHRMNTSLQGDSFQVGITLNDAQMRNLEQATSEIALHGMIFDVSRGSQLS